MADEVTKHAPRAALITGAGRRIGATIALALGAGGLRGGSAREQFTRGCRDGLRHAITGAGGHASVVLADLADQEAVRGLVPAAAAFGQLTLLVNNAGEFEPDDIETLSPARFQRAVAVNLAAPLFLSQAFAAQAPAGLDASIVNILDQRVLKPNPALFLVHVEQERAATPPPTPWRRRWRRKFGSMRSRQDPRCPSPRQTDVQFAAQAESLPLQRGPRPDDIAAAVLYLAQAQKCHRSHNSGRWRPAFVLAYCG